MKEKVKEFAFSIGADDVGVVAASDYRSPRSPDLQTILPGTKSLVILAYKSLSNLESENMQIAMGGRLDELEFARSCNYRMARFLDREFKAKAMTVPPSYPLYMSYETKGTPYATLPWPQALATLAGTTWSFILRWARGCSSQH
jgi:epoxyqueuosine reductase